MGFNVLDRLSACLPFLRTSPETEPGAGADSPDRWSGAG